MSGRASGAMTAPVGTDPVLAAADGPLRPWSLVRATPVAVWLLVAVHGLLGLAYALAVPLLHAPDEPAHVDLVAVVDDHLGLDPYDGLQYSSDVSAAVTRVGIVQLDWRFAPRGPWDGLDGSQTVMRSERPPYPDLAEPAPGEVNNPAGSHPPAYYAAVDAIDAVAVTVGAAAVDEAPWDAAVLRWRVWSLLLTLPLPWLVFWSGVRLSRRRAVGVASAVLGLALPQLAHSSGSVNNDTLLFPACGAVLLACAWIATGDRGWGAVVLGGLATGVAMITKIFGLGAPVWLTLAFVAAVLAGHRTWRSVLAPLLGAGGLALVAGGWWPTRLLLTTGTPAPRDFDYPIPEVVEAPFGPWLGEVVRRMATTSIGFFGIEQFALPGWLVAVATVATFVLLVVGAVRVGLPSLAMLAPVATTLAMVLYAAWDGYQQSGIPSGLHGRYLFVGLVGAAPLVAVGLARVMRGAGALVATSVGVVLVLQGAGLATVITSYWAGDGLRGRLANLATFAPWSGRTLLAIAVVGVLVGIAALGALVRESRLRGGSAA